MYTTASFSWVPGAETRVFLLIQQPRYQKSPSPRPPTPNPEGLSAPRIIGVYHYTQFIRCWELNLGRVSHGPGKYLALHCFSSSTKEAILPYMRCLTVLCAPSECQPERDAENLGVKGADAAWTL